MTDLYEKLKKFRAESYEKIDKFKDEDWHVRDFNFAKDVIQQLLMIAFCNRINPDTLPDVFYIYDVHFCDYSLEWLMKDIGYDVKAELIRSNIREGTFSFKVIMNQNK